MFAYLASAVFFLLFLVGVLRDRRRFSNAVLLGLTVALLTIGLLTELDRVPGPWLELAVILVLLVPAVGVLVLAGLLVANGIEMVRREGRSLANLLSLLAGLGILGVVGLMVAAVAVASRPLELLAGTILLVVGYLAFLFLCFVGYAFLYGRLRVATDVDFVVVLGAGLLGGRRVSKLLAARLDRGRAVLEEQLARGGAPVLLASGGQGPDEELPEAEAMAGYLIDRGFPPALVARESRSRTTEENLRYSREIMERAKPDYRCVIVTNNFHAFRAALTARRLGLDGQVIGAPTAAYFWPSATIREFVAVLMEHKVVNLGICVLLALFALSTAPS
ncbi:YdcF family protein [Kitasatospora sp. MMS16-BH015]|uniref:YdcF family protein n=1 Tax=Kitasatospora sp. MMS16-BH015 TaxID=2018025 RepID=UPI000CF2BE6E|nr:YdcF family protein [Kitasatospora sp. MMS16-BH015]